MLRSGITVWISPEGTRARDGILAPFKRGGFYIAADLGVPIIPAYIDGAEAILPPDQWKVLSEGDVVVRFGAPIQTAGVGDDAADVCDCRQPDLFDVRHHPGGVSDRRWCAAVPACARHDARQNLIGTTDR